MRRIGTRYTVPVSCRHRTAQAGLLRHTPGPTCATARRHAVHVSGTGWAAGQMWRRTLKTDWSLRSTSPRHAITTSSACPRRRRRRRRRVQWGRPGFCRPFQRRRADSVAGFHLARLPAALPGENLSDGSRRGVSTVAALPGLDSFSGPLRGRSPSRGDSRPPRVAAPGQTTAAVLADPKRGGACREGSQVRLLS